MAMTNTPQRHQQQQLLVGNTINQNVIYQEDNDYIIDGTAGSVSRRKNKKGEHFGDEGSENAPEDSGFLSDDGD